MPAVDESPEGYAKVANFQSSASEFQQYRGFLRLHSRVLLDTQYDIECLEKELDALDQWDQNSGQNKRLVCLRSITRDRKISAVGEMPPEFQAGGHSRTRPEVMAELKTKLIEYGK